MNFPLCLQSFQVGQGAVSLFVPDEQAVKEAYLQNEIAFPYWSKVWPAALALSEALLQQPQWVQNKTVLELGAGLGLPSIVSARFAGQVLCTDAEAQAVAIAALSAKHHGLQNMRTEVMDWNALPADIETDVVLLSDVNYSPEGFGLLQKMIAAFLRKESLILLATPQRLMAKEFVRPLLEVCKQTQTFLPVDDKGNRTPVTVLVLKKGE